MSFDTLTLFSCAKQLLKLQSRWKSHKLYFSVSIAQIQTLDGWIGGFLSIVRGTPVIWQ